eukprot:4759615-Prymnesium_polylepis.1
MALWESPVFRDLILGSSLSADPKAPPPARASLQALAMSVDLVARQLDALRRSTELGAPIRQAADRVHASFLRSADICRAMPPAPPDAEPMYNVVAAVVAKLRQLSPREALLVPAGFKDGRLLYVVHHRGRDQFSSEESFDVAVCSTCDGLTYHPARLDPSSGAVQYNSPLVLRDVPAGRVRDGAFWYTALRAAVLTDGRCTAATVYEQLLPYLNRKPLLANCAVGEETPTVGAGVEPLWLTPNEGGGDPFGHQLAALAATVALQLTADGDPGLAGCTYTGGGLALLLRHQFIALATQDLQQSQPPTQSVLELLLRASRRCSASSAQLAAGAASLSATDLSAMQRD